MYLPPDSLVLTESRAVSLHFASHIIGALLTQSFNSSYPENPRSDRTEQKFMALSTIFSNLCTSLSAGIMAASNQTFTIRVVTSSIITEHMICRRSAGSFWERKVNTVVRSLNRDSMLSSVSPSSARVSWP